MAVQSAARFGKAAMPWPVGVTKNLILMPWFLPVLVRFRNAFFSGSEPMMAIRSDVFLSFSLIQFQLCVFNYSYCLRLISHGWIICSFHVVAIDQLVWV